MQVVASTPAQLRALVQDFTRQLTSSAHPCWDAQVLSCLAVAARGAGIEPVAQNELESALGRCLRAHGSSRAHAELHAAVLRAVESASLEYAAPFSAIARLAAGFVLRRRETVRFRIVEGLVGVGDLDGAREVADRMSGFDRTRSLRVIESGVVRGPSRQWDPFVALLEPRVLARLSPTAEAVVALANRSLIAYEPWIAAECTRLCSLLDGRERDRALAHATVAVYFAEGRARARRFALSNSSRSQRANACVLLVRAALTRSDTELALEVASLLSGTSRARAEDYIRGHVRRRDRPARDRLVSTVAALPGAYRAHSLAFWLGLAFDQVRARTRAHPLFVIGARGDVDRPPLADAGNPLSLERALFDEGVAASPRASTRRRVLIRAAKHVLKRAAGGGEVEREVLDARLRMLERLGGPLACDAIESVLASVPAFGPVALAALETLAAIEPERGSRAFARFQRSFASRSDLERAATALEHVDAVERGFARAWLELRDKLANELDHADAVEWLAKAADACAALEVPLGTAAAIVFMRAIEHRVAVPVLDPATIVARALAELDRVAALPPVRCLDRLLDEPRLLELLRAFRPARLPHGAKVWDRDRVLQALDALRGEACRPVDEGLVDRFVRTTTRRAVCERRQAFLEGRCPLDESEIDLGDGLRLRWLDKRADLLSYVRFADAAECCLSSYDFDSQDVLLPWCDPMSFVCLVERREPARAIGFILAGFAWRFPGPEPVLVLNGVYLSRPSLRVRAKIVDAFEQRVAGRLGVVAIGIAAIHGGRGPLPGGYVQVSVKLERLRALHNDRGLTWEIFDDVVDVANVPLFVSHLFWRELRDRPVRVLQYR